MFSSFEPVQTILPDEKINAVDFGSLSHIITEANHRGLYSAFLAYRAICLRLSFVFRLTVETTFYICNLLRKLPYMGLIGSSIFTSDYYLDSLGLDWLVEEC